MDGSFDAVSDPHGELTLGSSTPPPVSVVIEDVGGTDTLRITVDQGTLGTATADKIKIYGVPSAGGAEVEITLSSALTGDAATGFAVAKTALGDLAAYGKIKVYVDMDGSFDAASDPHGELTLGSSTPTPSNRFSNMNISSDTVAENAASEVVGTVSVTHSQGQSLTFAVDETKHDGALFTFENNVLKLKATPLNYEEDNLKKVEFTVTDTDGETQSYTIDVKVSNVDEDEVKNSLSEGENVYLRGFGSFIVKKRAEKTGRNILKNTTIKIPCLLYTSPSPRDGLLSRMPSSA